MEYSPKWKFLLGPKEFHLGDFYCIYFSVISYYQKFKQPTSNFEISNYVVVVSN